MKFSIQLSDGYTFGVNNINLDYIYSGFIEASPGAFTRFSNRKLDEIHKTIKDIRSGIIKGRYILEPEMVDESDHWNPATLEKYKQRGGIFECGKCLKEYKVEAEISNVEYSITIEMYLSAKEIDTVPLPELIQNAVANLSFEEIKDYCNYFDLSDL